MPKGLYRIRSFLSIQHAHGDLCKHLGIDSSTDLDDITTKSTYTFTSVTLNLHILPV